ncbi:hypothetical protein D3C80_1607750 [compost metagenome]
MTGHQNGYIREIAIAKLMNLFPLKSVPYFVQLIGEYVMEIHLEIIAHITTQQKNDELYFCLIQLVLHSHFLFIPNKILKPNNGSFRVRSGFTVGI